jgi:hypothetical protein
MDYWFTAFISPFSTSFSYVVLPAKNINIAGKLKKPAIKHQSYILHVLPASCSIIKPRFLSTSRIFLRGTNNDGSSGVLKLIFIYEDWHYLMNFIHGYRPGWRYLL